MGKVSCGIRTVCSTQFLDPTSPSSVQCKFRDSSRVEDRHAAPRVLYDLNYTPCPHHLSIHATTIHQQCNVLLCASVYHRRSQQDWSEIFPGSILLDLLNPPPR